MPALHKVDKSAKLLITTWSGEATDSEFIDAFSKYQQEIRSQPDYSSYNEILDLSKVSAFRLSTAGIRILGQMGAKTDLPGVTTRLAIIVSSPVAFGLARMYEAYRSLLPGVSKEVRVFMNYSEAFTWAGTGADTPDTGS
jgi:hypothetical protein